MNKPPQEGCQCEECGRTSDGLLVNAITDVMGSQVVVTDESNPEKGSLLSQPLRNHATAVEMGKIVVKHGVSIYEKWRGPISTMGELFRGLGTNV